MSDASRNPPHDPSGGDPPRVLIVEPKRDYLAVLARRISEGGYRVVIADGPHAAMGELHRAPVNLVLADLKMANGGGIELVRTMRDDSVLRDIPVLMITGKSDPDAEIRAFQAGADAAIRKPFHFEVLLARIGREIDRASAMARLRDDNSALDARVVTRSIELNELREKLASAEAERARLQQIVEGEA